MTHILIVDDERAMCEALSLDLTERGYNVTWKLSGEEAVQFLKEAEVDAVVTDLNMKGMSGVELCDRIVSNRPEIPVIVVTGFGSLDTAVQTIRAGAFDFVKKPFDLEELLVAIERAIQTRELRIEVRRLRDALKRPRATVDVVGASPAMMSIFEVVERIAPLAVTALVTGEGGTGKERIARMIHERGSNPESPFLSVSCTAIPEALLESELFGHVKGAFTDAKTSRKGLFLEAGDGTLFLDEIGDLPLSTQAKVLRALEERSVRPMGGRSNVPFQARIIAGTSKNLESLVEEKQFRADLYYRINVIRMELPPLRTRGSDILKLAQHFLLLSAERVGKPVTGISAPAAERLIGYAWPGNVRELQNAMERAVTLTRFEEIVVDDLPEGIRNYRSNVIVVAPSPDELVTLDEIERRYVGRVLESVGGNKSTAAKILGLDRTTLYRMLARYGLEKGGGP